MINKKALLCILVLIVASSVNAATRVGCYQAPTAGAAIIHNAAHELLRGPAADIRNSVRINALVERHEKSLIYCLRRPDGGVPWSVIGAIQTILNRVFHLAEYAGAGAGGPGAVFQVANNTRFWAFTSGALGGILPTLFGAAEAQSIQNSYGGIEGVGETHGRFTINNAIHLSHTEPKALNEVLAVIAGLVAAPPPGGLRVSDVVFISRRPVCALCAKLLLNVINARRGTPGFPLNIVVMSRAQFRLLPYPGNIINSIHTSYRNQIVTIAPPLVAVIGALGAPAAAPPPGLEAHPLIPPAVAAATRTLVDEWRIINRLFTIHIDEPGNELALFVHYVAH